MIHEFDIFLSHASEDKDNFVNSLYTELTKEYRVWYDAGQIPWGSKLDEQIQNGLNKSKYGIVVLSDKYLRKHSEWIKQEFKAISDSNKLRPILHKIKMQDIEREYLETYEAIKNILAIPSEDISNIIKAAKEAIGEDSLCSQRNIDYKQLRDLLKGGRREEAAKETYTIIIQTIRQSSGAVNTNYNLWEEDADFNTIKRLWLKYTNGYFGKYDFKYWEPYAEEFKLAENEKVLIHTVADKQLYDIDKITVTGDKASEVEADYTKLRDLLKKKQFVEADRETARIILWATRREPDGWLSKEEIDEFPSQDLRTINQLWLSASNGKFGLSVQKSVWIEVCKKSNHEPTTYKPDTWDKFINLVEWNDSNSVVFELRAKLGHLPLGLYVKVTESKIKDKWVQKILEKIEEMDKRINENENRIKVLEKQIINLKTENVPFNQSNTNTKKKLPFGWIKRANAGKLNDCIPPAHNDPPHSVPVYFSLLSRADL